MAGDACMHACVRREGDARGRPSVRQQRTQARRHMRRKQAKLLRISNKEKKGGRKTHVAVARPHGE